MSDNYFSLDIDEKFTKVVESKLVDQFVKISALGKIETPEFFYSSNLEKIVDAEVSQIKKIIETLNIVSKNVNLIIPDSMTYNQIISMPLLNEKNFYLQLNIRQINLFQCQLRKQTSISRL